MGLLCLMELMTTIVFPALLVLQTSTIPTELPISSPAILRVVEPIFAGRWGPTMNCI